jgi:outer membrane lipoprotein
MDRRFIIFFSSLLLLHGCASSVPSVIRTPPADNPSVTQVRNDIDTFLDTQVRWGGTIADVQNLKSETLVEIVARELKSNGRPKSSDQSEGRFQARIDGFLDPEIYENGRALTVVGIIEGDHLGEIGEHPYRYPLVNVSTYYLWNPLPASRPYYYDPWFYDPWWPYPYYYGPHYHHRW